MLAAELLLQRSCSAQFSIICTLRFRQFFPVFRVSTPTEILMPAIDCTRYFPPGNSGTSAYHQRESADGLSFLLHPRFSCGWFFSFDSMCDIVNLYSARGRKPSVVCPCFLISNEFPARGRKHNTGELVTVVLKLHFLPARGQKSTSATGVCQQRRCFAFSYILFYRLGAAPDGIVFVTGSALTPCGTFRFKGRISCR